MKDECRAVLESTCGEAMLDYFRDHVEDIEDWAEAFVTAFLEMTQDTIDDLTAEE